MPTHPPADLVDDVERRTGSSREARWIVEHAAAAGGGPEEVARSARALADRRAAGEPLQYVLGTWPFRTVEVRVDRRVLVPRPETEHVVGLALDELARVAGDGPVVAVDLGTGSGAVALALAVEGPGRLPGGSDRLSVWATDASSDALAVAAGSLADLAVVDPDAAGRVTLAGGSWYGALPPGLAGRVDLVVANPPYVTADEYLGLEPVVRSWEPRSALVAARGRCGVDGTADVEAVVEGAPRWLRPGGSLVVELAPHQAYAAIDVARRAGFRQVAVERDLAGRLRVLVASR